MAYAHEDPDTPGGTVLHITGAEHTILANLVLEATEEDGRIVVDDGPLMALLEALCPTETVCSGCGDILDEDTAIYATPDGKLTTRHGDPYCDGCLPSEED